MTGALQSFLFGRKPDRRLPDRVRHTIERQQEQSERLISWAQLCLGLTFGLLWLVSPPPLNLVDLHPVPWALSAYLLFTGLKLLASHRWNLPSWFLAVSIVVDMTLLMVLIWSFHIKYAQPPSFYLKAPTLMYVFIFISLRALRFDPAYIITAGLSAAVGWTVLMGYVIWVSQTDMMITRDYVAYMTSNAILIGAEIDKILSILVVTAALAVAVMRARRTLYRAALEGSAAEDLSRFVSREVADHITSADSAVQPGDGESRVATVMFTDIEKFSTFSESMSAAELATTLNEYFGAMCEAIDRFGGVITQFQGDAMLITYNAVTDDQDHAANALHTALAIQEITMNRTFGAGHALKTRCGVNTGEISVGAIGAKNRLAFTVHGDDVNVAARLEQLNKDYGTYVMTTNATLEAAGDGFRSRQLGEVTVRGRTQPTPVFAVDGGALDIEA